MGQRRLSFLLESATFFALSATFLALSAGIVSVIDLVVTGSRKGCAEAVAENTTEAAPISSVASIDKRQ